jgi:hypothetical protein
LIAKDEWLAGRSRALSDMDPRHKAGHDDREDFLYMTEVGVGNM